MISEIKIVPVRPVDGLIGFASCVYNNQFYFGSIALHQRFDGSVRLVFPKVRGIDCYHPIAKDVGVAMEREIGNEYAKLFLS